MKGRMLLSLIACLLISWPASIRALSPTDNHTLMMNTEEAEKEQLVVVWTSGDREVAEKMVFMYTYNAKKYSWWEDITLLVWGPSAKLLTEDEDLQQRVKAMLESGIHVLACKGCADMYGISAELEEIGVTVRYTGTDLTDFIKERHVITF
jgi:hypothetical protein